MILFNNPIPGQRFIVTDIVNNSGLHPFSKGYITSVNYDHGYINVHSIITRVGKEGKPRCINSSFYTCPLLVVDLYKENKMNHRDMLTFIVSENIYDNLLTTPFSDFLYLCVIRFINYDKAISMFKKDSLYKELCDLKDYIFNNDSISTDIIKKYDTPAQRLKFINFLNVLDRFFISKEKYLENMLETSEKRAFDYTFTHIKEYLIASGNKNIFEKCMDLKKSLNIIKEETKDVFSKFKSNSYWI